MIDSKKLIKEYELNPNKALGQNFLIDENAIRTIAELAHCDGMPVLEIGPGLGALTDELSLRASSVIAVEIDKNMVELLSSILADRGNIHIINRDFLRFPEKELTDAMGGLPFVVAANLPYYITTPAALRLIDSPLPIQRMVLMMQEEAAAHFTAGPRAKQYTPLSVLCACYYNVRSELHLPPSCYYPEPAVHSVVLSFERNEKPFDPSLSSLVKASFAMRRKTLRNNLSAFIPKDAVPSVIEKAGLPASCRAEELTPGDFVRLNDAVNEYKSKI